MPKILLVEDNELNRDLLSRRLERRGYTVVMAIDGEQGVDMALTERPDLILMDIILPGIDGFEATRQIKATAGIATIPVIALKDFSVGGDRELAYKAGCNDYMAKPIDFEYLMDKLASFGC